MFVDIFDEKKGPKQQSQRTLPTTMPATEWVAPYFLWREEKFVGGEGMEGRQKLKMRNKDEFVSDGNVGIQIDDKDSSPIKAAQKNFIYHWDDW